MKRKVKIVALPTAQSGGSFNFRQTPWQGAAGQFTQPDVRVGETLKPVPREQANLEAEKGEVAMTPGKGGIPDTFKIGGQRHSSGGTPLNLPADSFIFSDTRSMKIKDPALLDQFGMPSQKGGYTPAEIAKKYPVNKYKKFLADPDSDDLQRSTAELMISNYNMKLAKLGLIQESMKGFPQGIPMIAMPYIEAQQLDPAQFTQGQQPTVDDADEMAKYGGTYQTGGATKSKKNVNTMSIDEIYRIQQNLLPYVNDTKFAELYTQYDKVYNDKFKKGERIKSNVSPNEPMGWYDEKGVRQDTPAQGATGYWNRVAKKWSSAPDWGNEAWIADNTDPSKLKGAVPTKAAMETQEFVNKLTPSNSNGVLDYLGNVLSMPQKGMNLALTGNYETPGTTYLRNSPNNSGNAFMIDVATDPLNLVGVGEAKAIAKGAYKGAKYIGTKAVEYAPIIAEKTAQAAKYIGKAVPEVGKYVADLVAKYGPDILKNPYVQNIIRTAAVKGLSNAGEDQNKIQQDWWNINNPNTILPPAPQQYVPVPLQFPLPVADTTKAKVVNDTVVKKPAVKPSVKKQNNNIYLEDLSPEEKAILGL
jgi:hypothetical protein